MTHFILHWITIIDVLLIVAECYSTEHKSKHHTHQTHKGQLFDVYCYGLEDVTNLWNVAKDVHQVKEEEGRVEEGTEKGHTHIQCHAVELSAEIEGLVGITSSKNN